MPEDLAILFCQTCTVDDRWNGDMTNVCLKAHEDDDKKFYKCENGDLGKAVEYTCPGSLVWNQERLTCWFDT